jgi:CheY-like chemotaxis protein
MGNDNIINKLPMTVLCVDDELDIIHAIKRLLRRQNYNVLFTSSGEPMLSHCTTSVP